MPNDNRGLSEVSVNPYSLGQYFGGRSDSASPPAATIRVVGPNEVGVIKALATSCDREEFLVRNWGDLARDVICGQALVVGGYDSNDTLVGAAIGLTGPRTSIQGAGFIRSLMVDTITSSDGNDECVNDYDAFVLFLAVHMDFRSTCVPGSRTKWSKALFERLVHEQRERGATKVLVPVKELPGGACNLWLQKWKNYLMNHGATPFGRNDHDFNRPVHFFVVT